MMQRMKGTLRPGRKAGVLALAVLLLTCVLMAGAVSATEFNQSNFTDNEGTTFSIIKEGTYVLNKTATGNITIDVEGDVTLEAIDGAILNGGIEIKNANNVTVDGMHINSTLIRTSTANSNDVRNVAIIVPEKGVKLVLKNNIIGFNASATEAASKGSSVLASSVKLLDGSEISGNTITGVTAHVLNLQAVDGSGKLTVQGNTVTMKPDEKIHGADGRALLKIHPTASSDITYLVCDNVVVTKADGAQNDSLIVRVDRGTSSDNIKITMYNNTYENSKTSSFLYGGTIYGYQLGKLRISETQNGPCILTPGLNQTGVVWSGGADAANQELELNKGGSYKLMDDVTINSMTVSAENVVIDGNKDTCTLTLLGTAGQQGVITVDHDATLKNLNVVAAKDAAFGTAIKVNSGSLTNSKIDLTNQNAKSSDDGPMSAIAVSVVSGEISYNTILAGNSEKSSSQCVVVSGSGVTVSGNTLTTGESAAERDEKRTSGSVGIRLSSGASGTTFITNNRITSTEGEGLNNGIAADGVKDDVTIEASGNTFVLAAAKYGGGAFYVNPTTDVTTVTLDANGNTVESAASFIYADNAEGAKTYAISGKIENNDFAAADKGLVSVSAEGFTPTLGVDYDNYTDFAGLLHRIKRFPFGKAGERRKARRTVCGGLFLACSAQTRMRRARRGTNNLLGQNAGTALLAVPDDHDHIGHSRADADDVGGGPGNVEADLSVGDVGDADEGVPGGGDQGDPHELGLLVLEHPHRDGQEGEQGQSLVGPGEVAPQDVEAVRVELGPHDDGSHQDEDGHSQSQALAIVGLIHVEGLGHGQAQSAQSGVAGGDGQDDDAQQSDDAAHGAQDVLADHTDGGGGQRGVGLLQAQVVGAHGTGSPHHGDEALQDHHPVEGGAALPLALHGAGDDGGLGGVEAGEDAAGHGHEEHGQEVLGIKVVLVVEGIGAVEAHGGDPLLPHVQQGIALEEDTDEHVG